MERITIKLSKETFDTLVDSGALKFSDFEIKEIQVIDNFFDNDLEHKNLKDKSLKSYKNMKEYEFKKRHDI